MNNLYSLFALAGLILIVDLYWSANSADFILEDDTEFIFVERAKMNSSAINNYNANMDRQHLRSYNNEKTESKGGALAEGINNLMVNSSDINPSVFNPVETINQPAATMLFEENKGQIKDQHHQPRPDVLFSGRSQGLTFHLREDGISYQISKVESWTNKESSLRPMDGIEERVPEEITIQRVDVSWFNANSNYTIVKGKQAPGYNNYYNVPEGADPVHFVKSYESITLENVWDGVNIELFSNAGVLELDWVMADPRQYKQIAFEVEGAELSTDDEGNLIMSTPLGEIREGQLKVFQEEQLIEAEWKIDGKLVAFNIEGYDENLPMRIDPPVRLWGTYYGGSGIDYGYSCVVDMFENVFIAGRTESVDNIATSGAHQITFGGGLFGDAFMVKFNSNGVRQWGTYYGGSETDIAYSSATDNNGNIYIAGETNSPNMIATPGAHQEDFGDGFRDAFLVKFDSNGVRQWGTYYGAQGTDIGFSCAVSPFGNVYLSGETSSSSSIATPGAHQETYGGGTDAFLVKFDSDGVRQWGTYYGGGGGDFGNSCVVDNSGNIYLGGRTTSSSNIATPGAHQENFGGGFFGDAFLVKFDSNGVRQWGTYYGGEGNDFGYSCAVDNEGNVFLTGNSNSTSDISTPGSHQELFGGGNWDAFLVKFNPDGLRQWATYYGGEGQDDSRFCITDEDGNVFIAGYTWSSENISTPGAHQETLLSTDGNALLVKFDQEGVRTWGTYYGAQVTRGRSCATDGNGNIYLTGSTWSGTAISTPGAHQETHGGGLDDAFLVKFKVNADYCTPSWSVGCDEGDLIDDVIMPEIGIEHLGTGCSPNGYGNFTGDSSLWGLLVPGETYSYTINNGFYNQGIAIYIDFEGNQSFDDPGNLVAESPSANTHSGTFTVPVDADPGLTIMRVISQYAAIPSGPCPTDTWGEAHDYHVEILPSGDCVNCFCCQCPAYIIDDGFLNAWMPCSDDVWWHYISGGLGVWTFGSTLEIEISDIWSISIVDDQGDLFESDRCLISIPPFNNCYNNDIPNAHFTYDGCFANGGSSDNFCNYLWSGLWNLSNYPDYDNFSESDDLIFETCLVGNPDFDPFVMINCFTVENDLGFSRYCIENHIGGSSPLPKINPSVNGTDIIFTVDPNFDDLSTAVSIEWDMGDGTQITGNGPLDSPYTYSSPGKFVVNIEIEFVDSSSVCMSWTVELDSSPSWPIGGSIQTYFNVPVNNVMLSVTGDSNYSVVTNQTGFYELQMANLGAWTVTPEKDTNWTDGVTTIDLIIIQQHLVGINLFSNPYMFIAADANDDGVVSTFDLVLLQALILGTISEISGNSSWRFIPTDHDFDDPNNPLAETWPESRTYVDIDSSLIDQDYIAVKIGDVSGDAGQSGQRTLKPDFNLAISFCEDENAVMVLAGEDMDILGFQMEWSLPRVSFGKVDFDFSHSVLPSNHNHHFIEDTDQGTVRNIWWNESSADLKKGDELFRFTKSEGSLRAYLDHFELKRRGRLWYSEAYGIKNGEMTTFDLKLDLDLTMTSSVDYRLYQNEPNPFSGQTVIPFRLPRQASVEIEIINPTGSVIQSYNLKGNAGLNQHSIDLGNLPSGVLFYRVKADEWTASKKMIQY